MSNYNDPTSAVMRLNTEKMSESEIQEWYDEWCVNYDHHSDKVGYQGAKITAKALSDCITEDRENKVIVDIAAGTGLVADELYQHGFRIIDAVDPSESMLEVAKKKNIYRNYYYEYVTEKPISIPDNTYDGLTMSGALLFGHINCCALPELIRLVKPGGFVVMVTKYANLETVEEYKGRFLVKMDQLEEDGQWKKVKIEKFDNYHLGKEGVVIVYQIC